MNTNSQQESPNTNQNGSLQGWALQNTRVSGGFPNHQNPLSQGGGGQATQQHMIQQLIQGMNNNGGGGGSGGGDNGGGGAKPSLSGQSGGSAGMRYASPRPHSNGPTRSNSFKGASHISEDIVGDIACEFMENGFFNNDDFEYGWKG